MTVLPEKEDCSKSDGSQSQSLDHADFMIQPLYPIGGMMYPVPGQPLPISMVHSLQYQEQLQVRIGRSVMQTGGDGQ